jgi:hypothetical protein
MEVKGYLEALAMCLVKVPVFPIGQDEGWTLEMNWT